MANDDSSPILGISIILDKNRKLQIWSTGMAQEVASYTLV